MMSSLFGFGQGFFDAELKSDEVLSSPLRHYPVTCCSAYPKSDERHRHPSSLGRNRGKPAVQRSNGLPGSGLVRHKSE